MKVTIDQFIKVLTELKQKTSGDAEVTFWSDNPSTMNFRKDGVTVGYVLTPEAMESLDGNMNYTKNAVSFEITVHPNDTV